MQFKEKSKDGLNRVFDVKVSAKDLSKGLDERIEQLKPQINLKGFRKGKVPTTHIHKVYGRSIMGEIIEQILKDAQTVKLDENKIRPASQPELNITSDLEKVFDGKDDLTFELSMEIMPEFDVKDFSKIELTRPTADVPDADITDELQKLADTAKSFEDKKGAAKEGDQVIINFVGKVDGEEFAGGKADDAEVVIGAGRFIPGFEEGLTGAKAGDKPTLNVTFPEDYPAEHLRGKDAVFETEVKAVKGPVDTPLDDELAKKYGLQSLDTLKDAIKGRIESEYGEATRQKMKRQLLDAMDEVYDFELPAKMLEEEFNTIWTQVQQEKEQGNLSEEDAKKSEKDLKAEYEGIAERRVRLGLVLAEVGRDANIQVNQTEISRAINAQASQFPGQEKEVAQYFQKNPDALARLRAPIFEEKVIDHIFAKAKVKDVTVSKDELFAEDDAPVAKPKKKAAAKKSTAKKADDTGAEAKKAPAKKKPAAKKATEKKATKAADKDDKPAAKKTAAKKATAKKEPAKAKS